MSDSTFARLGRDEAITRLRGGVDSLVVCHVRPDADALGSALAVCLLLRAMDCRALCVCQHEIPERLRFLVGDMQESILVDSLPADFTPAQIIAVDTASPSQMGDLYEKYRGAVTLMIDHHGKGEMYADGWVRPDAAATGEMIYDHPHPACRHRTPALRRHQLGHGVLPLRQRHPRNPSVRR